MNDRKHFLFLNIGHFLDHLFTLIFASVAALVLTTEWDLSYAELIPYATPGFIAFGAFSLVMGWLADRWSREGMMAVFFIGIGLSAIATSMSESPLQIAIGLFVIGVFAAIYHPVGLAMIAKGGKAMGMDIAVNGVWGNLGVACAALLSGYLIDQISWRAAFWIPGILSVLLGFFYIANFKQRMCWQWKSLASAKDKNNESNSQQTDLVWRALLLRITIIIFFTTAVSSVIFQGTTFSLPKIFEERLGGIASSPTLIGWLAFFVFAVASLAQVVVGRLIDRYSPRNVFAVAALIQLGFFLLMPGLSDWAALLVAFCFMLGAFGQIPITDFMIGKMAKSELRASIYGTRYIVSFAVSASVIPLIAWVHHNWGFDSLFYILATSAFAILAATLFLPSKLPAPNKA